MTAVLQKYRIILIIFSLAVLGMLIWFALTKQNPGKIPSRGMFVLIENHFF